MQRSYIILFLYTRPLCLCIFVMLLTLSMVLTMITKQLLCITPDHPNFSPIPHHSIKPPPSPSPHCFLDLPLDLCNKKTLYWYNHLCNLFKQDLKNMGGETDIAGTTTSTCATSSNVNCLHHGWRHRSHFHHALNVFRETLIPKKYINQIPKLVCVCKDIPGTI